MRHDESDFLDLTYGAALDAALWPTVIERFADLIGGSSGQLTRFSVVDNSGSVITARMGPEVMERYFAYYASVNPLHKVPDPKAYLHNWVPRVLTDEDWMPKDDLLRSEFYNDFLRARDVHSVMFARLAAIGDDICVMNISRPKRRGPYDGRDIEVAERLHPHLIRAFDLARRLQSDRALDASVASVFDHSPHGLFVLDHTGAVQRTNTAAQALVTAQRGLRLSRGRLGALQPAAAPTLEALIRQASLSDPSQRRGGSMRLMTGEEGLPLSLIVAPIGANPAPVLGEHPAVIVCVTDLSAGVALPEDRLKTLFGLTRSEARIALALFEGLGAREVAEAQGVSFHTVRAHVAHIFEKTGVSRQSELVGLMMRSVGLNLA